MRIAKIAAVASAMLLLATLSSAQIVVDPNNNSCWENLSSLRACQSQQVERAAIQAQECTSFPEYQCTPEETVQPRVEGKKAKKNEVTVAVTGFQPHADQQVVVRPAEVNGNQR